MTWDGPKYLTYEDCEMSHSIEGCLANGLTGMLLSELCAWSFEQFETKNNFGHLAQVSNEVAIFAHLIYYPASFAEIWSAICDYKNIVICQTAFVVPNLGNLYYSCIG